MQKNVQNLPASVPKLQELASRLIKENSQLKSQLAAQEQRVQMAKQSMDELQSLVDNPLFQQSIFTEQNKQLQKQLEKMMQTEKEARQRIIQLEKQALQSRQEYERQLLKIQNESVEQANSAAQLNAILESEKIQLRSFFKSLCDNLGVSAQDNVQQAELEALGEISQLKTIIQSKQNEIYSLQQKQEDFYDEKEDFLAQMAAFKNDEAGQANMDAIERQLEDLQAILEKLQAENTGLRQKCSEQAQSLEHKQQRQEILEKQLQTQEISVHMLEPMNQEINRLKAELEQKNQALEGLQAENRLLRDENVGLQMRGNETNSKVDSVVEENAKLQAKVGQCEESIQKLNDQISQMDLRITGVSESDEPRRIQNLGSTDSRIIDAHTSANSKILREEPLLVSSVQIQTDALAGSISLDKLVGEMLASSQNEDRHRSVERMTHFDAKSDEEDSQQEFEPQKFSTQTCKTELNVADFLSEKHQDLFNRVMQRRLLKLKK